MVNIANQLSTFDNFLYTYVIFLFFFVFIIGLAGSDLTDLFSSGNLASLEAPAAPVAPVPTGNGMLDWLTSAVSSGTYFVQNIIFFFTLMTVDSGVSWLGAVVLTPAFIFMIYGVMRLIRGGG